MKFDELHSKIPYVTGSVNHVLMMTPYDGVTIRMPGRHQLDTSPIGGDMVVEITDDTTSWESKQFTHQHIFDDFQDKADLHEQAAKDLMQHYARIVLEGVDVDRLIVFTPEEWQGTINPAILLAALQCLAVAEHRRYARYEAKMGGRFLPARFVAGIVYGHWTASDAKLVVRKGRPGVEMLERLHGKPPTLQELANQCVIKTATASVLP